MDECPHRRVCEIFVSTEQAPNCIIFIEKHFFSGQETRVQIYMEDRGHIPPHNSSSWPLPIRTVYYLFKHLNIVQGHLTSCSL